MTDVVIKKKVDIKDLSCDSFIDDAKKVKIKVETKKEEKEKELKL